VGRSANVKASDQFLEILDLAEDEEVPEYGLKKDKMTMWRSESWVRQTEN
jgi:hypothetical protein